MLARETMLCRPPRRPLCGAADDAINAIWSGFMSTTLSETAPLSLTGLARLGRRPHEANSWVAGPVSWHLIRRWAQRRVQRRALAYLTTEAHLIADLGLSRQQALHEARKPFWRR
jgi:uncharacterized protein YjiS (DUF1127 family)